MSLYRRYRAPDADGAPLVDPDPAGLARLLQTAHAWQGQTTLGGVAIETLRESARRQLIDAARTHTGAYFDTLDASAERLAAGPIVVSGHQPEWFHPGVWFKNFALDALAAGSGGVGIHLIVDSDLSRGASLRVPTGTVETPELRRVAYDDPRPGLPHELRPVASPETLAGFAERAASTVAPFVAEPLVASLGTSLKDAAARTNNLGLALSETRHRLEHTWGLRTLEVSASDVCDGQPFRRFAAELLLRTDETRTAYNAALADYRDAHRVKNTAQPLPDLATDNDWIETPLWVYSEAGLTRRPLFVRQTRDALTLGDRAGWSLEASATPDGIVAALHDARRDGVRVRSRALVTTLYARLLLADLFLHGIGGAKYDEVTDRFAARLLGDTPPRHATLTATLRLPVAYEPAGDDERARLLRWRRELVYHPERHPPDPTTPEFAAAAEQKHRWFETAKTPANAGERHRAIREANRVMSALLDAERRAADDAWYGFQKRRRAAQVLGSREHAFCLFPADDLRERLARLADPLRHPPTPS